MQDDGSTDDELDSLFAPKATRQDLICGACGKRYAAASEQRFCSACGGLLHAEGAAVSLVVLVADDAVISRRKVTAILKHLGCRTVEAADGREAVDLVHRERPNLLVLDVHMPAMNGIQVLEALREDPAAADMPIVMLTGEADASVVRDALARGARDYIRKDSTPAAMQERLNKHVQLLRAGG